VKAIVATLPEKVGAAVCVTPETCANMSEVRPEAVMVPPVAPLAALKLKIMSFQGPIEKLLGSAETTADVIAIFYLACGLEARLRL